MTDQQDGLTTWHDDESATAAWSNAATLEELPELLDACKWACWLFVPRSTRETLVGFTGAVGDPDPDVPPERVPSRFRLAQLRQMQNVARTTPGDAGASLGLDSYAPRVYVFGYDVRTILLPPTAGAVAF